MRMNTKSRVALLLFVAGLAVPMVSRADTVYVDQRYGPGGNGTAAAPYDKIQTAINDANSATIIVYPGTYSESLNVTKSLAILSYDGPHTTTVEASAGGDALTVQPGYDVWLQGFTMSTGRYGVLLQTSGSLHLRNNIFCGNSSHGVYVARTSMASSPQLWIHNCILVKNGGSGLFMQHEDGGHYYDHYTYPAVEVYNSILIANTRYGIESSASGYDSGLVVLDYNDSVDNAVGAYSAVFPTIIPTGPHSISVAPGFVGGSGNACNQDFRLIPTSPCKDTGHPGIGFLDPDGTRNDMGAYGGPGAARFYTNPNDGPVIRDVSIDQGMVPRGSTFTIRAKGVVR
jgi:hypothetical protein